MDKQANTLTIPLTDYINKIKNQNKFSGIRALVILGCCYLSFMIYALRVGMFESQARWTAAFIFGCVLFGSITLLVVSTIAKARKLIRLLDAGAPNTITLNNMGIEFPLFLLIYPTLLNAPEAGKLTVKIAWKNIVSWYVVNPTRSQPYHSIKLAENSMECTSEDLSILRILSKIEENALLDYAQHFLEAPIKIQSGLRYKDRQ